MVPPTVIFFFLKFSFFGLLGGGGAGAGGGLVKGQKIAQNEKQQLHLPCTISQEQYSIYIITIFVTLE